MLNADGIHTSAGCPKSCVIEVDCKASDGTKRYGELNITSRFPANATGPAPDLDITATPVILAEVG